MSTSDQDSGWYSDPTGRYANRYWDGTRWTETVNNGGTNAVDPISEQEAVVPPAPGMRASDPAAAAPSIQVTTQAAPSKSSPVGIIVGALVAIVAVIALVVLLADDNGDSGDGTTGGGTGETPPATQPAATTGSESGG